MIHDPACHLLPFICICSISRWWRSWSYRYYYSSPSFYLFLRVTCNFTNPPTPINLTLLHTFIRWQCFIRPCSYYFCIQTFRVNWISYSELLFYFELFFWSSTVHIHCLCDSLISHHSVMSMIFYFSIPHLPYMLWSHIIVICSFVAVKSDHQATGLTAALTGVSGISNCPLVVCSYIFLSEIPFPCLHPSSGVFKMLCPLRKRFL